MFCHIPQVNQLTALLIAHSVRHVVVCPGSRNATIVHNLHQAGGRHFQLHPVTDERSAAFVALGMSLALLEPVAVCVTSGSALLGCIPAVAEAYYRHLPLLVISADRPQSWIGQLDGQTLPQQGALLPYCRTFQVGTPHTEEHCWYNNRQINEAILSLSDNGGTPAHINVSIEEPMFTFNVPELPQERVINKHTATVGEALPPQVVELISRAKLPALLIGQYERGDIRNEVVHLARSGRMLVLPEIISDVPGNQLMNAFDRLCQTPGFALPDVIVHIGGNFVHKSFKNVLRTSECQVVRIGRDANLPDTFCNVTHWVRTAEQPALAQLCRTLPANNSHVLEANKALARVSKEIYPKATGKLTFDTVMLALRDATEQIDGDFFTLHLANSTAVRAAAKVFSSGTFPIFCNRGVNGIEGSLSAAVGYSMAMWGLSLVVIGDLSFFYDVNALWNVELPDNLRILLVNNAHGGIFDQLPGLEQSRARNCYIAAGQYEMDYNAEGIARTFGLDYARAESLAELKEALPLWLTEGGNAHLLEVRI